MNGFIRPEEKIELKSENNTIVDHLVETLSVPKAIAQVLSSRNLTTYEECRTFFRPDIAQFHDPFLFRQMEQAIVRINRAIAEKEKIIIFGDYDVDGITSTVLMMRVLTSLGAHCSYILPNRLTDGYGLSKNSIEKASKNEAKLIITVDCGISAISEVAYAKKNGIDCIITDHHEVHQELPNAYALINPKITDCNYPCKYLAGVGVALKVCQALALSNNFSSEIWEQYLDIVSLGTAADIVPLTGENRIISFCGFSKMMRTTNKGLQALMELQGLSGKQITTSQIVYQIAPCINAVGRLGKPDSAVELLLTENYDDAKKYARELLNANTDRRTLDTMVATEVQQWVEMHTDASKDMAIIAGSHNWHAGVIGIAASKMVERYNRPAILFSIGADGYARGSGRSIPSLNLMSVLDKCSYLLKEYGGHAAAAGITITAEAIPQFRECFNSVVSTMLSQDDFIPVVHADAEVEITSITPKFYRIIKQMEPFGPGNMRPVFVSRSVTHRTVPRLLKNAHIKMSLHRNGCVMDAIAFNWGERYTKIKNAEEFSIAYTIDQNEWNGKTTLQMKVKGITL